MKRTEINKILEDTIKDINLREIPLPSFGYFKPSDWKVYKQDNDLSEIYNNSLGWDVTDFGEGNYYKKGLTSFTFRNGNPKKNDIYPKPYCEKLLVVEDGQELPFHFHWSKMEDIINRGGGVLELTLFNSNEDETLDYSKDVEVSMDGIVKTLKPGSKVQLHPGDSITLSPYIYHKWEGVKGTGKVFLFEVSTTNDDETDNRFLQDIPRLIDIDEDSNELAYLTISDYINY